MKLTMGVLGALLCWSVPAAAQVKIVNGGPAKSARGAAVSSLRSLDGDLKVCWRGKRPAQVQVAVTVSAAGKVIRAVAKTRGAVAQCAAGVIAVQALPSSRRGYRMTVSIPTRRMAAKNINAAIRAHMANLRSCYSGRGKGSVGLRFRIDTNGAVSNAQVTNSTLNDPATQRCLTRRANSLRLQVSLSKPVSYSLSLRFDGKTTRPGPTVPRDPKLQPRKRGPLGGGAITRVVRGSMAKITACYENTVRRMRRKPSGRVVIRFTIRGNGTVRNVKVRETTLKNKRVEACIVKVGNTFRFPAEAGRAVTKVWYPFSFRPR